MASVAVQTERDATTSADQRPGENDEAIRGWTYTGLDYPTFRLVLLAKAIDRLTLRMLDEHCDLTIAEWRVLSRLAPIDGATVRQVAQMAWVDRAEVSRAASALETRGLVGRRDNPGDRRAPILFVTPAGNAEYERLLPIRAKFHGGLTEDMSEAERDMLDQLLGQIARKLGKLVDD
ncbi:MarR family winged helix-turn-helix transcriptional regulator [Sphingomonas baiyangensis]|uniref:Winged helix-turn-helix transcriptional regulator n=1 Tax=Sphingomonas baiyangensis TaxID=2572576 RepID=A0A4U1L3H7_9SPHN|nr:MarR family winged helix-turn-helix transcriptional regulator [Sphingomonas baiyangensis]TKD50665.1 winged helix-turn-helix transcriptional regulator [Sphingomonas baiyangensis]